MVDARFAVAFLAIVGATTVSGRRFNNPVLDNGDYPDPGGIKVGDRYYVVTTTNNQNAEKYPIMTSTDLQNWEHIGYMFDASNLPPWSDKDHEYWAPEIHQIGNKFVSYWVARATQPNQVGERELYIGVATADSPAGPWKSRDQPLWRDPVGGGIDPNLMNDNGELYLLWKGHADGYIEARKLNPDGLSMVNPTEESAKLFKHTYDWEAGQVEAPWYIRHGRYHYIMYSGEGTCSDKYAIGVARSLNPLGPYEKRGDPIMVMTDRFRGPGHNSVVKDVDNVNDVMLYHIHRTDVDCGKWRPMNAASIGWGDDEWPYLYDYE